MGIFYYVRVAAVYNFTGLETFGNVFRVQHVFLYNWINNIDLSIFD